MGSDLETAVGRVRLRNPTILAAGILGLTGPSLLRVWNAGAGAVVSKSISREPSEGYPGPTVVQTPSGLLNAMGLPNPGVEDILGELREAKKGGATVIASVFGGDGEEFASVAREVEKAKVDAVELNLSCPHSETLSIIGHDPDLVGGVVERTKEEVKIPVWAKLPGNTHIQNLVEVAKAAEATGADALTVSNTYPAMAIDLETGKTILGHGGGGLSGPAIKPISVRLVYEVYEAVRIPVIGSGGVVTSEDAIEYLMAGASAVQIGTGIMERGLGIFEEVCSGIRSFMKERGFGKISEIIGLSH